MRVLTVHHVQLAMPKGREDEARAFYGNTLGLTEVQKPEHLRGRGGCWFQTETGFQIHLGVEDEFHPAKRAHPALLIDDLAQVRARLAAHGIAVTDDTQLEGFQRFYAADPFGNRLEFLARPEP